MLCLVPGAAAGSTPAFSQGPRLAQRFPWSVFPGAPLAFPAPLPAPFNLTQCSQVSLKAFLSSMLAEELLVTCSASWRCVCTRHAGSGTDAGVASPAGVVGAFSLLRENRVAQQLWGPEPAQLPHFEFLKSGQLDDLGCIPCAMLLGFWEPLASLGEPLV